ncbi:hypothetical protein OV079_21190 [Nannocystis pusilla]|uniref:Uncharacterized protein n=1 Tax=Nannocystis pusilla TaxID=889268 RepID=A0A9X3ERT7_9BACT|nr:hypothetical protein [Nannocystis pusilla]MCY1008025.1 hypothetical protein [Nannocystis pusilla]
MQQYVIPFAWKAVGAIVLWIVGGILISGAGRVVRSAMTARGIDPTFSHYVNSALSVLLKIILLVAILGLFGVESTSFAAVLAAAGVAIGMAWSGLWPTSPPASSSSSCARSRSATPSAAPA